MKSLTGLNRKHRALMKRKLSMTHVKGYTVEVMKTM